MPSIEDIENAMEQGKRVELPPAGKAVIHPLPAAQLMILTVPGRAITCFGFQWGNEAFSTSIVHGADRRTVANALAALAQEISLDGRVASGGTWLDRVKTEHAELSARMKKLAAYFADGYPGMEKTEDIAQLNDQYLAMENYRAILAARIENAEHAARTGPGTGLQPNIHGLGPDSPAGDNPHYRPDVERHPPMEGLEDGSAVREIGEHDPVRDGPIKFDG